MIETGNALKVNRSQRLISAFLILLPAFFLLAGLNFNRTQYSNDPEYAYLLNGLNISRARFVGHAENPGTTVQILSAVIIPVHYLFEGDKTNTLQEDVIRRSDEYVETINKTLVILNSLLILFMGITVLHLTKSFWMALLVQAGYFLSANLLEHAWTKVSPEPVLVIASSLLALAVLVKFYSGNRVRNYPVILGWLSGFGLATKVTFLPLLVIPLIILSSKKERISYLRWTLISAFVITIPAILEYPHMAKWFLQVFIHTGTYGQGGIGILNPSEYFANLLAISGRNPLLVITSIVTLLYSTYLVFSPEFRTTYGRKDSVKYALAFALAQLIAILIVAKHYHANHYLIPAQCLIAFCWIMNLLTLTDLFSMNKRTAAVLAFSTIMVFILASLLNYPYLKAADHGYKISNEEYHRTAQQIENGYNDYLKIYYYPTSINPYSALRWGNVYSRSYNLPVMERIFPQGIFYDTRNHCFMKWDSIIPAIEIASMSENKILLIGGPLNEQEKGLVNGQGLELEPVYSGRTQAIYKVDISNSTIFR
jgi:hypothetical protein